MIIMLLSAVLQGVASAPPPPPVFTACVGFACVCGALLLIGLLLRSALRAGPPKRPPWRPIARHATRSPGLPPPLPRSLRRNTPSTAGSVELARRRLPGTDARTESGRGAYCRQRNLLSKGEWAFFQVLMHVAGDRYLVFAKVRLGDIVRVVPEACGRGGFRNKIERKHIDFVLCDRNCSAILLAIELDDRSHKQDRRRRRDAFVNECLRQARLPLLRVPAQQAYDVQRLGSLIESHIAFRNRSRGGTGEA